MAEEDAPKVEKLILDTLRRLEHEGFTQSSIEAAVNTIEFSLRCDRVFCVNILFIFLRRFTQSSADAAVNTTEFSLRCGGPDNMFFSSVDPSWSFGCS